MVNFWPQNSWNLVKFHEFGCLTWLGRRFLHDVLAQNSFLQTQNSFLQTLKSSVPRFSLHRSRQKRAICHMPPPNRVFWHKQQKTESKTIYFHFPCPRWKLWTTWANPLIFFSTLLSRSVVRSYLSSIVVVFLLAWCCVIIIFFLVFSRSPSLLSLTDDDDQVPEPESLNSETCKVLKPAGSTLWSFFHRRCCSSCLVFFLFIYLIFIT